MPQILETNQNQHNPKTTETLLPATPTTITSESHNFHKNSTTTKNTDKNNNIGLNPLPKDFISFLTWIKDNRFQENSNQEFSLQLQELCELLVETDTPLPSWIQFYLTHVQNKNPDIDAVTTINSNNSSSNNCNDSSFSSNNEIKTKNNDIYKKLIKFYCINNRQHHESKEYLDFLLRIVEITNIAEIDEIRQRFMKLKLDLMTVLEESRAGR